MSFIKPLLLPDKDERLIDLLSGSHTWTDKSKQKSTLYTNRDKCKMEINK